ncbi:MAG: hypothetical protein N3A54_00965 [Patescibacteria group bacterium]|nr:hypothetical protein [Patescibacteria group bacterium]
MEQYDIWFRLAAVGATIILVYGKIFEKIRPRYYFFHCPMCVGFHVGWLFSLLFLLFYEIKFDFYFLFKEGCINSLFSYFFGMFLSDDGINIYVRYKVDD